MRKYLISMLTIFFLLASLNLAIAQPESGGRLVVNDEMKQCAAFTNISREPPGAWGYMEEEYTMNFANKSIACEELGYDYIGELEVEEEVENGTTIKQELSDMPKDHNKAAGITPDSSLYALDRGLEKIRKFLATSGRAKESISQRHGKERLAEAKVMAEKGDRKTTSKLLNDYSRESGKRQFGISATSYLMFSPSTNSINISLRYPSAGRTRSIYPGWITSNNTYLTRYSFDLNSTAQIDNCTLKTNETGVMALKEILDNPDQGYNKIFHNTTLSETIKWNIHCFDVNGNQERTPNRTFSININPVVNVTFEKKSWDKVLFNASGSYDPDGNITEYEWNFWGGPKITTQNSTLVHEFNLDRDYSGRAVSVRAIDNEGGRGTTLASIDFLRPLNESSDAIIWRKKLDVGRGISGQIRSDLGFDGENVYVGTHEEGIFALDKMTGNVTWSKESPWRIHGDPLVEEGVLYQTSPEGVLYALNLNTQKYLWNTSLTTYGAYPRFSRPTSSGDNLYLQGSFYKINKSDGSIMRSRKWMSGKSEPVVEQGVVYFGGRGSTFHAVNATNLQSIWSASFDYSWSDSKPIVLEDEVISCADGVYGFDKDDGDRLWKYKTGSILGDPTVRGNVLYVGTKGSPSWEGGKVHAMNMTNHEQIWNYSVKGGGSHNWVLSKPKVKNGLIYVTTGDGRLEAINQTDGTSFWHFKLDGWSDQTPIIDGNRLYVSTTSGGLVYAFNLTKISGGWASPMGYEGTQSPYAPGEANVTEDQQQNATSPYEEGQADTTESTQQNATGPYD